MKAAKLNERPPFSLMKQTDIQNVYHMQMPRWLFSDPRYCDMSLDAKVTYTFLLNRFQLSRRNNWVNDQGEVFVIFPRKALAKELRICEQRIMICTDIKSRLSNRKFGVSSLATMCSVTTNRLRKSRRNSPFSSPDTALQASAGRSRAGLWPMNTRSHSMDVPL